MTDIEKKIVEAGFVYTNPGTFRKKIQVDLRFCLMSYAVVSASGKNVTVSVYLGDFSSFGGGGGPANLCLYLKSAPAEEFSELVGDVFKVASEKFAAAAQKTMMISMTGMVN